MEDTDVSLLAGPLPIANASIVRPNSTPKLRQRNIQIQAMQSMDRVTDEEDNDIRATDTLRRRTNVGVQPERPASADADTTLASKSNSQHLQQLVSNSASTVADGDDSGGGGGGGSAGDVVNETQMVIVFANTVPHKALHWIVDKIRGKRAHGGADLLIRMEPQIDPNSGLILHVTARSNKFLQFADELELMKKTKSGVMKNFNVSCLDDFFLDDNMSIEDVLTPADRQLIVKHALDCIKAAETERCLPGMEQVQFYHGQSIVEACVAAGAIESVYALQDRDFLRKFGPQWYLRWFDKQPIEQIREYFGESYGIYFSFVEYYTVALCVPAILGIFQYFLSVSCVPYFCVFYVIWLTIYLEVWKRKCSALSYRWGTIHMTNLDVPRIGFYGTIGKDPITGRLQPQYPIWRTYAAMYLVSAPLCLLCIIPAGVLAVSQFWLEARVIEAVGVDSYWTWMPSIFEAIIVAVFSGKFESLATWLTDRENHRTQAQYERHRVIKLIALEFVNNFLSLFYIAFWLHDVNLIGSQLMTQLVVFQIVQKLQGTVYPVVMAKLIVLKDSVLSTWYQQQQQNTLSDLNVIELDADDERIEQNKQECVLMEYSTYEDYLEMYIQFGYVVLFASVAPLAAAAALLNNCIEIRLDAFKLCRIYRRPLAKRAKNTGAWLLAFETLLVMSIITNCGLLYLQPEVTELTANRSQQDVMLAFVIVEHLLLAIAWLINKAIPDRPWWVRVALAKADFESRQAVKREVAQRSAAFVADN